jgi:hypothetical protein
MKLETIGVGLARYAPAVIHASDEISAYEHNQRHTLLGAITREAPATEKPRLEVLDGAALGQVATGVGIEAEHHLPES